MRFFASCKQLLGEFDFIGFDQGFADFLSLGLQEGVSHASADDQGVHFGHQIAG